MEKNHMRKYSLTKIILLPLLLLFSLTTHASNTYSNVYIFGDSLSDTGNLASVIGGIPAPYYKNRISNGPVAVDVFTEKMGFNANASLHLLSLNAGTNYAVAGARASGNSPIDLDNQILAFQANHGFTAPKDALYVMFLGGNDVRDALYEPNNAIANTILHTALTKVSKAMSMLSQMGAHSFLVINVPNIALIPETSLIAKATNNPTLIKRAEKFTKHYNKKLHKLVEKLEHKNEMDIKEFSLFKLFGSIVKNSTKLGFSNSTEACFSAITFTFHPDCNYGLNAEQFIFFDEIHPTKRVHAIFGNAFYAAMNDEDEDESEED